MSRPDHNESNDYSFMLQSIEKKLTSTITAQVNEYYKKGNQSKRNVGNLENLSSPISKDKSVNNTIELPSHIMGLHSPPNTAGNVPFIDHSLSSIKHSNTTVLKKRRISHELNSDENTFYLDDHTAEIAQPVVRPANSAPFSKTITLQSQIDELTIINENQKEQMKLLRLELEHYKDTSIKQLSYLEAQNKKLKQEIEDKTHKYYEDKKKWQLKVKEIEQNYQKKGMNTAASTSGGSEKSSSHYAQYIQELQQQVQSLNKLLSDKLNEHEVINQQKLSLEKKTILLENDLKTVRMQLQFQQSNQSIDQTESTSDKGTTTVSEERYHKLEEKLLQEKLTSQKQIQQTEKQLQLKNNELNKLKEQLKNQLLLEEEIVSLKNEKILLEEKKEEFLDVERKYFSLLEEKKHWQQIFTKIQNLLLPANTNPSTATSDHDSATLIGGEGGAAPISHMKIMSLIQSLQEKYLILFNDNQVLQNKVSDCNVQLRQKEKDCADVIAQSQQLRKELERKEVLSFQSTQQLKTYEREIQSLRQLLQTYDFEFSLNSSTAKPASQAIGAKTVTEDTMVKLKNDVIDNLRSELDELRKQYQTVTSNYSQLQQEKQDLLLQQSSLQQQLEQAKNVTASAAPEKTQEDNNGGAAMITEEESDEVREWKEKYEELSANYQQLQQMSGIDYLPQKTKILRFVDNPSMKNFPALSSATSVQATTFPPEQLRALKQENRQLRQEVEKLREAAANPSSSANSALNLSDENIPAMTRSNTNTSSTSVVDPNKLNQRLKEIFKEKINTLRHGIYLLTGYQVELSSTETLPRFKLKNVYAENADDFLLFQMDGDNIELLESKYALTLDATTMTYLSKYNSFPAFLSNLTLQLFENQTYMA